jgi:NO-binding membrane sensor protein with MHYT domain
MSEAHRQRFQDRSAAAAAHNRSRNPAVQMRRRSRDARGRARRLWEMIAILVIGGSLWTIANLNHNMVPMDRFMQMQR